MADETAELLVSIRADLSDLKAKFDEGKDNAKGLADEMEQGFKRVGERMLEFFAIEKLLEFFKEGIAGFAEFELALNRLQETLNDLGKATATSREEMKEWAETIAATTLFTKDEALTTLNKLVVMTGDLEKSLGLSKLAMDVSAKSGIGLELVTKSLGNAYEGNYSGLGRLLNQFPQLKRAMEDGKDPIMWFEEHMGGFSETIGQKGVAGALDSMKKAWKEMAEGLASDNEGALIQVIKFLKEMAYWIGALSKIFLDFINVIGDAGDVLESEFKAIWKSMHFDFSGALDLINSAKDKFLAGVDKLGADIADTFVDKIPRAVKKTHDALKGLGDQSTFETLEKTIDSVQDMLDKMTAKTTMTMKEAVKIFNTGIVQLKQNFAQTPEQFKKMVKDMEAEHKAAAEVMKKTAEDLAHGIEKTAQSAASAMTKAYMDGTLTVAKGFEILGKAILKSLVEAVAQALEQESVKAFITATALAANPLTAAGAPGFYATAGIEAAGAGVIMGVAEAALADGGYVNAPTLALIGEDGPEKVTPLSKGHPMDKGQGDTFHVTMSFPGVKSSKDFTIGVSQTAARRLFTDTQNLKTRSGNRNTSF